MKAQTAIYGPYIISRDETGKIVVKNNDEMCPNAIAAIRTIAQDCRFELDPKWNTQTAGAKLIQHILSGDPASEVTTGETYLYLPGYEYDHDKFAEDIENEDTEGYEDDWWGLMSDVERGDEEAERVSKIDLNKPGLYIKDLERRTYAYVFDGEIVVECD